MTFIKTNGDHSHLNKYIKYTAKLPNLQILIIKFTKRCILLSVNMNRFITTHLDFVYEINMGNHSLN